MKFVKVERPAYFITRASFKNRLFMKTASRTGLGMKCWLVIFERHQCLHWFDGYCQPGLPACFLPYFDTELFSGDTVFLSQEFCTQEARTIVPTVNGEFCVFWVPTCACQEKWNLFSEWNSPLRNTNHFTESIFWKFENHTVCCGYFLCTGERFPCVQHRFLNSCCLIWPLEPGPSPSGARGVKSHDTRTNTQPEKFTSIHCSRPFDMA